MRGLFAFWKKIPTLVTYNDVSVIDEYSFLHVKKKMKHSQISKNTGKFLHLRRPRVAGSIAYTCWRLRLSLDLLFSCGLSAVQMNVNGKTFQIHFRHRYSLFSDSVTCLSSFVSKSRQIIYKYLLSERMWVSMFKDWKSDRETYITFIRYSVLTCNFDSHISDLTADVIAISTVIAASC